MQALREAEQKGGQALFGALLAEQQQHVGILTDLLAEQAVHLVLQAGDGRGEFLESGEGDLADRGGFQDLGRADMHLLVNGVQADDLARQMKTQHLFAAFRAGRKGLDGAGLDDDRASGNGRRAKQEIATVQRTVRLDDVVETLHVLWGQTHRQA